jgi:hypothetical protein
VLSLPMYVRLGKSQYSVPVTYRVYARTSCIIVVEAMNVRGGKATERDKELPDVHMSGCNVRTSTG